MHPLKKSALDSHNDKLRAMTRHYGSASGPDNNLMAPVDKLKVEGPEDNVGFGADSSAMSAKRGDRTARRSVAANPVSTYKRGGRVKHRDQGGDVSDIETANAAQTRMSGRARGGRMNKKGATNVNVIVAPQSGAHGMMPGMGMNPMAAGVPPMMPPALGATPPMVPGAMGRPPMPTGPIPPGAIPPGIMPPRKRGGRVAHPDVAEDRALVKQMVKGSALKRAKGGQVQDNIGSQNDLAGYKDAPPPVTRTSRARGGRLPNQKHHMTAGAVTGEGRLEKIGKKPHDAGRPQEV